MFCKKVGFNRIEVKSSFAPLIELMFTYLNPHDTKKKREKNNHRELQWTERGNHGKRRHYDISLKMYKNDGESKTVETTDFFHPSNWLS